MKRITIKTTMLIVAMVILMMLAGCDGEIRIRVKTYEWVDAPTGSESMIYISNAKWTKDADPDETEEVTLQRLIESIPNEVIKEPLWNVKTVVNGKGKSEYIIHTNMNGDFNYRNVAPIGKYKIDVEVSKDGYRPANGQIEHRLEYTHVVVAVLVKSENGE